MRKLSFLLLAALPLACTGNDSELQLERIRLPAGFKISVYARGIDDARSLALAPDGAVFVGSRRAGKVYALLDRDGDHRADEIVTVAENLNTPNGVDIHGGALYVAEQNRVLRFPDIAKRLGRKARYEVVSDKLPDRSYHGWRYARFGPDGKLYVAIGAPCNVCKPDPDRFAVILRMDADGGELEPFARGVRNSVGFDWRPGTGDLWFTDNGRDELGDDQPPDELNHAARAGMNFGYPYCHGRDLRDPEFGKRADCSRFAPPALALDPHGAALGMRFYTGRQFPPRYRNGAFIAQHGSWNRSEPIGYRVLFVPFSDGKPAAAEVFAEGWLRDGRAWGRPVDVLVMPDGSLLVSDDRADAVYRIAYGK